MKRAAIVGGGIGGLAVAIALRKIGFDAHVYERAAELKEVGSALSLWPNALRSLQEIDPRALQKLRATSQSLLRLLMKDAGGALVKAIQFPSSDFSGIAVHRAVLHSTLAELVPANSIHLNHTFSSLEIRRASVILKFGNGAQTEAGLVIGSDGIRSAVRKCLGLGCKLTSRGYVVWRGMSRIDAPDEIRALGLERDGDFSESYGHGQRFGILRLGAGRVHWYATANSSVRSAGLAGREEVMQIFSAWHSPIPDLIQGSESIIRARVQDRLSSLPWSKGAVALLGDAAHPISPDFGQGACLAIEDAVVLASYLRSNDSVRHALVQYEKSRHKRCREILLTSRETGRLAQIQNRALVRLRNRFIKLAPSAFTTFWLRRSWNFFPPPVFNCKQLREY